LRRGTVPGAVATGSLAPGRYRSRYRTGALLLVHPIENRSNTWRNHISPISTFVVEGSINRSIP